MTTGSNLRRGWISNTTSIRKVICLSIKISLSGKNNIFLSTGGSLSEVMVYVTRIKDLISLENVC